MSWVLTVFIVMAVMSSLRWSHRRWEGESSRRRIGTRDRLAAMEAELDAKTETIELLEARVNELETRLDFTERLLAQREGTSALLKE